MSRAPRNPNLLTPAERQFWRELSAKRSRDIEAKRKRLKLRTRREARLAFEPYGTVTATEPHNVITFPTPDRQPQHARRKQPAQATTKRNEPARKTKRSSAERV